MKNGSHVLSTGVIAMWGAVVLVLSYLTFTFFVQQPMIILSQTIMTPIVHPGEDFRLAVVASRRSFATITHARFIDVVKPDDPTLRGPVLCHRDVVPARFAFELGQVTIPDIKVPVPRDCPTGEAVYYQTTTIEGVVRKWTISPPVLHFRIEVP